MPVLKSVSFFLMPHSPCGVFFMVTKVWNNFYTATIFHTLKTHSFIDLFSGFVRFHRCSRKHYLYVTA